MTHPTGLPYEFCALTDVGRVRNNNEDAVAVFEHARLVLLADGMGGYNAGEVASSMAVSYLGSEMACWIESVGRNATPSQVRQALQTCVNQANQAILHAAQANSQYRGMGTTVVIGVFHGGRLILGHIGDSRCYRLRANHLQQLTRDHSWLQEQVDAGILTPEEAEISGQRNLLTRALGVEEEPLLEINEFAVEGGDLYILCSDGLSEMVEFSDLQDLLNQPLALAEKTRRLVDLANAMGGRDNISVVLASVGAAIPMDKDKGRRSLMSRFLSQKSDSP